MRTIIIFGILFSSAAQAQSASYVNSSIKKAADKVGVPEALLSAVCYAESRHIAKSYAFADGGSTSNHAFGICQILNNTAKDFGLHDKRCEEDFRYRKQERTYENCKLFGPYTNAYYAAKYLKYQLNRYNNSWINAIAAYNAGSVKLCKTGWVKNAKGQKLYKCEKGGLFNQRYVDRVLKALQRSDENGKSIEHEGLPKEIAEAILPTTEQP